MIKDVQMSLQLSKGKIIIATELIRIEVEPNISLKSFRASSWITGMSKRHAIVIVKFLPMLKLSLSVLFNRFAMSRIKIARLYECIVRRMPPVKFFSVKLRFNKSESWPAINSTTNLSRVHTFERIRRRIMLPSSLIRWSLNLVSKSSFNKVDFK